MTETLLSAYMSTKHKDHCVPSTWNQAQKHFPKTLTHKSCKMKTRLWNKMKNPLLTIYLFFPLIGNITLECCCRICVIRAKAYEALLRAFTKNGLIYDLGKKKIKCSSRTIRGRGAHNQFKGKAILEKILFQDNK